jgi:hypothetical protein
MAGKVNSGIFGPFERPGKITEITFSGYLHTLKAMKKEDAFSEEFLKQFKTEKSSMLFLANFKNGA